jgi:ribosomal protein S18 acetylase RimI-like enzyme
MPSVSYRPFTVDDTQAVTAMIESLYAEDPTGKPISAAKITRTLERLSAHPDMGEIMVIGCNELIAGYAILINAWSNEFGGNVLVIDELYVKPDFRCQGIATDFISYLKKVRYNQAVAIELEVTPENTAARRLYQRLGFSPHTNQVLVCDLV